MARVLLLEDHEIVCTVLAQFLKNGDHEVVASNTSTEVLDHIASFKPDVIVTDIIMPEMDGIEVIRQVRHYDNKLPVIAISGGGRIAGAEYLELAEAVGAAATLEKPFDEADLLHAVDDVVKKRQPSQMVS